MIKKMDLADAIIEKVILGEWKKAGGIYKVVAEEVEKELEEERGRDANLETERGENED